MDKEKLQEFVSAIRKKVDASRIILYNQRVNFQGEITSFKLCVIIKSGDTDQVEKGIYLCCDSPVPYDVLVYTQEVWDKIASRPLSFASKIERTGQVLYG